MSVDDLLTEQARARRPLPVAIRGTVTDTSGTMTLATFPAIDGGHHNLECEPAGHTLAEGDTVLAIFDDDDTPWIVAVADA